MTAVRLKVTRRNHWKPTNAKYLRAFDKHVGGMAKQIETNMRNMIQNEVKTGRLYGNHRASAPGQAPASMTGELLAGIGVRRTGRSYVVYSNAPYTRDLEYGTSRMASRPFMRPSLKKAAEKYKGNRIRIK